MANLSSSWPRVIGRFCPLLVLLFVFKLSAAQQLPLVKGMVVDSLSGLPLAFVNIGVVGKGLGTVSSEDGNFYLDSGSSRPEDILRFSLIGYRTFNTTIGAVSQVSPNDLVVRLSQQAQALPEVTVTAGTNGLRLGTIPRSRKTNAGFFSNKLGHEIGSTFEIKGPVVLDSVRLNFAKCLYPTIYLRLNVYAFKNGAYENVLRRPHYISFSKSQALARPIVDLRSHDLYLTTDFLITVELVKDLGEKGLYFFAHINDKENPGVYRSVSHDAWRPMNFKGKPVGISIEAFVH